MDIVKAVEGFLRSEYESGMTQDEMAKRHNVAQPQIGRLLSGQRNVAGLTLDTFVKMFPRATVNLSGDVNTAIANAGHGNNFFADAEQFRQKAIATVIDLDLAPDAMQTVLRALKNLK